MSTIPYYYLKMENQRNPLNPLVNRLYKNFSETKLQKSLVAKDISSINGNSSMRHKNILVPLFQSSQRQSSLGKSSLLEDRKLQDISMISRNSSIHHTHKNRFNKMILEDSKILEDQSAQNQHNVNKLKNKLRENKGRVFKKKAIIRSSNKGDHFGVEEKDLTLNDFLNLLRQEPDVSDEFVYLKIVSHPYDLRIVDYDHKSIESNDNDKSLIFNKKTPLPSTPTNQQARITVSARGITYLNEDQPVFVTIDEWQKEAELYGKLTKLSFFKQYRVWKNFCVWKKYIRRINMKKVSEILSRELLFADKHLRPSLLYSKSLLLRLENIKLCKLNQSQKEVPTYLEFKEEQSRFRTEDLPHNINYIEEQILANVLNTCKLSLKSFKEENRIGNNQSGSGVKTEPLLIGDNSNKPMPYTQQATVKTHYQKLTKYMKLIDNFIIDGKLKLILQSVTSLRQTICSQNDEYHTDVIATNQKLMYKGHQWFLCEIFFQKNHLVFDPDLPKMQQVFQQLINKGVTHVCKRHKSIKSADALVPFISVEEEKLDIVEDVFNLEEIVRTSEVFTVEYVGIGKEIERSFSYVQNYSKRLLPLLEIYRNNSSQDLNSYLDKDPEIIEKYIEKWRGEDAQLNRIVEEHESSMLLIQTQKLKQTVKNCASVCLEHIYKLLPEMLRSKFLTMRAKLKEYKQLVDDKPANVEEFISLNQNVNRINQELDDLSTSLSEVNFIYSIIKNNKSAMGESMETLKSKENKLNQLNQLMVSLRGKIDEATMKMNTLKVQFLEQINKISPQMNTSVQQNYIQVSSFQYNTSIQEVVEFLHQKQLSLNQIFEVNKKLNYYQKNLETQQTNNETLNTYSQYFNKIHKIWLYKQRMEEFSQTIKTSRLNTLDIESEWVKFETLLVDIETLSKECITEEEPVQYELSSTDKSTIFQLQEEILSYTPVMKSIKALKSQILKEKEWEEIKSHFTKNGMDSEIVNQIRNSEVTLDNILTQEIYKQSKFLTQIAIKANHQADLVVILQKVGLFWTSNYISCNLYEDYKDVYILDSNTDLFQKIHENLVELSIVKNSKYVDTVLAETERQTKLFSNLQEVLNEWKQHENNWLMLQPLLNNTYFKGFPKQIKAFTMADNAWRKIVKLSRQHPVKRWAEQESILQTLKNNQAVYFNIKKLIPEFLRKKRETFPRFYMVSDQELTTMISECKDFRSTEPHLWRVFPAIERFDYNGGDKESQPSGLVNFDGEIIPLKTIRVGVQAEEIFKMLQDSMKQGVKSLIKSSLSAIEKQSFKRKDWMRENPFQVVHFVDMLEWTRMVENDYLNSDASEDLSNLYYVQHLQLNETIELLNDPNRKISEKVLNSLLIQNIEYRDAVERLIVESVESVNDFNWAIQIKSYYQNETFVLRQGEDEIAYGYEFLRVFDKLPICPQTEKARLGLFQLVNNSQTIVLDGNSNTFEDMANISGRNLIKIGSQIKKQFIQSLIHGSYVSSFWLMFVNSSLNTNRLSEIATMIDTVRVENLQKQNSERFKESAFALHIQSNEQIPYSITNNLRNISFASPDEWFILEIQLYKQGLVWAKELLKQLRPLIVKVQDTLDINLSITALAESFKKVEINSEWENDHVILSILSATRNFIIHQHSIDQSQIDPIFNGYLSSKNMSLPNYVKLIESKEVSLQSQSVFEVKSGVETERWIRNEYSKRYPEEENILFLNCKTNSKDELFGHELSNGNWVNGSLQTFLNRNSRQKWIIIEQTSSEVRSILNLGMKDNVIYFSNLSKHKVIPNKLKLFYLSPSFPALFPIQQPSSDSLIQSFITTNKNLIKPYYSQLFKEYFTKTLTNLQRSFRDWIEFPSNYILINQLLRITSSFLYSLDLSTDINDRGLQKLFSWCLFLTLSNRVNLETHIFDKFCKVYQDCIKFQHIKVTNLSQYVLEFSVPEGTFRLIQSQSGSMINCLSPKISLMKMLINSNQPLVLLGSQGSLKSTSINQLIQSSPKDHKFIHYFATTTMKLLSFINFILNQLDISKSQQQFVLQPKGFNNSKLSIFVDNVNSNQQIFHFVQWFAKEEYRKLWVAAENRYVRVSERLTVNAIVSGRGVIETVGVKNLLPINFNIEVESALLEYYSEELKDRVESSVLDSLIESTSGAIASIRNTNANKMYSSHYLSRFLMSINNSPSITKQDWIDKMVFVYTSQLRHGKQAIVDLILKQFNVTPQKHSSSVSACNLHVSSIRIVSELSEFQDRYHQLQGKDAGIVRYQNKRQIQKLTDSQTDYTVYFSLSRQNYMEEFQIINQLSHNSPEFVLIVDLESQQLLDELYIKYSSTIDKCFAIAYESPQVREDSLLENAFTYFKGKIGLNRNHYHLMLSYYQQLLKRSREQSTHKVKQLEKILADYSLFKEKEQKLIDQCTEKSQQVKQRYFKEECLFGEIKDLNVKLTALKYEIQSKNQKVSELGDGEEESESVGQLKMEIVELEKRTAFMSKELASKEEQVQNNTKNKDILKSEISMLNETIQDFSEISQGLQAIIEQIRHQLAQTTLFLENKLQTEAIKQSVQIAYLSKHPRSKQRHLLHQYNPSYSPSCPQRLIENYISLTGEICCIYDPNRCAAKTITKLYPQRVVPVTNIQKIPQASSQKYLMMYIRQSDRLLNYFIENLRSAKPSKIILILDYVSERYPCLNFESSLDLEKVQELVMVSVDQYLKESIHLSEHKMVNFTKSIRSKEDEILKVISNGVVSEKLDYLKPLMGKLHQLTNFRGLYKDQEGELNKYIQSREKYIPLVQSVLKLADFITTYPVKINKIYQYSYQYISKMISNAFPRILTEGEHDSKEYIDKVLNEMIQILLSSIRKEDIVVVQFAWCLVKTNIPPAGIDILLCEYLKQNNYQQNIMSQLDQICENVDIIVLRSLRTILDLKIRKSSLVIPSILKFISYTLLPTESITLLESNIYLVERSSSEVVVELFFKDSPYKILTSSEFQKMDEYIASSTSINLVILCQHQQTRLENLFLKLIQIQKSVEKEHRIVVLVENYEELFPAMLMYCPKVSMDYRGTLLEKIRGSFDVESVIMEEGYSSMSLIKRGISLSLTILFGVLERYSLGYKVKEAKENRLYMHKAVSSIQELDSSNKWVLINILNNMSHTEEEKEVLKVMFFKILQDISTILNQEKEGEGQTLINKLKGYSKTLNIDQFSLAETWTERVRNESLIKTHHEISYQAVPQTPPTSLSVGSVSPLKLFPLINMQQESHPFHLNSIQQLLQRQILLFNQYLTSLNQSISSFNTFLSNKQSPDSYFQSILYSLHSDCFPPQWIHRKSITIRQFNDYIHHKTEYLTHLKDNDYKIKHLSLAYLSEPKRILKKLIESEQKKIKSQYKVMYGKLIPTENIHPNPSNDSGILITNLKLRYCKYDQQKSSLESSVSQMNGSVSVLLVWGEMPSTTPFQKLPIYHKGTLTKSDLIHSIDLPLRTKQQLSSIDPASLLAQTLQ